MSKTLSGEIKISLVETEHQKSRDFKEFCDSLIRLAPNIQVQKIDGKPDKAPFIQIGENIRFQALPTGTKLGPFLEALTLGESKTSILSESMQYKLCRMEIPAILDIYVAPQCKFCAAAIRQVLPLVKINSRIQLGIKDCTQFPELVEKADIRSVPTMVLDDRFRWTGAVELEELLEIILDRDPRMLGPTSLEMILKDGNAHQLAAMMLEKNDIFPAFYDLLTHDQWPVRLGAMVVMEELISTNLKLAVRVQDPLWKRFLHAPEQTQGDILYIFGELGQKNVIPALESVLGGQYNIEVKEAAGEALDKLQKRQ